MKDIQEALASQSWATLKLFIRSETLDGNQKFWLGFWLIVTGSVFGMRILWIVEQYILKNW
jgi:hypothetical protein